ncbi:MAG TPA: PcfJ domain-containing protein, partial [Methylotenera sp.]|nr:PcfJ domain-containing protein [Methylotenera sp.]
DFVPRGAEKFLSKIVLLRGKSNELELIKRVIICADILDEVSHWDSVPIQALYIIERYPELSGAKYLEEWCSRRLRRMSDYLIGVPEIYKTTLDTIELGITINIKNSRKIVKACNTINQLNVLHDKWTEVFIRTNNYYDPDIEFVEPEINETEEIKWISSANDLIDEGIQMEHCVATYIKKVIGGHSIIFSILFPERATAEIRKRNGSFELVELKLKRNQEASAQTFERVNDWLRNYNLG